MANFWQKLFSTHAASPIVVAPSGAPVRVATRKTGRFAAGTAAAALLVSVIGGEEGLEQIAYPDPASKGYPWTVCYGHTGKDVTPGVTKSLAECKQLLLEDTAKEWAFVQKCVPSSDQWGDDRAIAAISLAHNIGGFGFCNSSIARDFNAGNDAAACDAFLRYDMAAGMHLKGLAKRRARERTMCIANRDASAL